MSVLKAIDQLLRQRPLSRRAVETLLGLPLREDTKNTNPTLRVYRSFRGEPPWQRVELRVPEPRKNGAWGSSRSDSLLVLELEPNAGQVDAGEVEAMLGPLRPFPSRPEGPAYREAATRRGPVRLGFDPAREGRLQTIVIDAI